MSKKFKKIISNPILWASVVLVILLGVLFFIVGLPGEKDDQDIALQVNDHQFSFDEFNRLTNQIGQQYMMSGMNLDANQLKEMTKETLIQQALLMDIVDEKNITVSPQELENRFQETLLMYGVNEEQFMMQVQQEGLDTRAEIDEILTLEIKLDKYIEQLTSDFEVGDQEVQDVYDQYVEELKQFEEVDEDEIPSLEEIKEDIRQSLIEERVLPIIMAEIEKKQAQATIISNLDDIEIEEPASQMPMISPEDLDMEDLNIEDLEAIDDMDMEVIQ